MIKKLLLGLIFIIAFILPINAFAQTEEQIQSFNSKIKINTDSTIEVKEEINYYFPSPKHGIYRYLPFHYKDSSNNKYFQTPIENVSVADNKGQPIEYSQSQDQNYLTLKIGDAEKTVSGPQTYIISYKVTGVLNYFDDHDELYWNVTGDRWTVAIGKVTAEITLPGDVDQNSLKSACYTGETGSKESNCTAKPSLNTIIYSADKGPLTTVTGWNKGVVTTIERKYEIQLYHESAWYLLIPLFVLLLLIFLYFSKGRDPFGRGTIAPEFEPPDSLKPAEIGTLIDEKADNSDLSATIIDLAVRGFLKIREKNKKYTLIKLKSGDSTLKPFEKDIFAKLFSSGKEVDLEDLYKNFSNIKEAKKMLYEDLVEKNYFKTSPDKVRGEYLLIGFIIIFFSGIFFWLSWILVFSLGFSGLIFIIFSKFMPKKTREGVIAKEKSLGFKEFLYRAERYRVKWQEKEGIFEKYLPYAMVFGIAEVWAKNFKGIYKNPPDWYEGDFTTFNAVVFVSSLNSFSQTATHSFSPPSTSASGGASGFGGGGFSGGGFGGGGGGSW